MELQGAKRYLLVGLGRGGGGRKEVVDGEQRRSAYGIGGKGVLVEDRRRGAVGELRESEAELLAGSAWAEELWSFRAPSTTLWWVWVEEEVVDGEQRRFGVRDRWRGFSSGR